METTRKIFRIDRKEIAYLRFLFEAYDGLAVLTTLDPRSGLIFLDIAPGCEDDVATIMGQLAKEMIIEPMDADIGEYE